ncbi:G8 domain-containing protein [Wenjunlia tyrosinilytica]|uniref:G8 domain-containing protein n=1 Tax=Wenjunlia tyrosinilytica TaxID=1544741 RepID=A0A917ZTD4_9ACTN|nr:right-handed parallel beta-helix repeat-containing protein [Wenjunlia tyrosinilytica]GGO91039.1 hypothetical protein GCM10012280_37990 [Wenjunlia tyrosinilytica]
MEDVPAPRRPRPRRRRVLAVGAAAGAAALAFPVGRWSGLLGEGAHAASVPGTVSGRAGGSARPERRWSDARGWHGGAPARGAEVYIRDAVLLDTDADVGSLVVEEGGSLRFAPSRSTTLTARGNVVLRGRLAMAPARAGITHRLVFAGVDESRFRGAAMDPDARDTGLWVRGKGQLVLRGTARTAWARAAGSLAKGSRAVSLAGRPRGWRPGDEVAVVPTGRPDGGGFHDRYDMRVIASVEGALIRLTEPLSHDHPAVRVGAGTTAGAEVLNLTRNARIEGSPSGRAHIHIMSTARQRLSHAALRWLGPRQDSEETWRSPEGTRHITEGVLGRYPLHFHMMGDATRGTVVDSVVVRDCGNHAFVPHNSHGITLRDCVSHNTWDDAYWWDGAPDTRHDQGPSHDLRYERCVASRVRADPPFRGYRLTGFALGAGHGSAARGCVAVGVRGTTSSSGFFWPEGGSGTWEFTDCVAHNNAADGIFVWQNNHLPNTVRTFLGYHNGGHGIEHGAYLNDFAYRDCVLHANGVGGVLIHALGAREGTVFGNLLIDGGGLSDHAFATARHTSYGGTVTITGCRLLGHRTAGIAVRSSGGQPDELDIAACEFTGNELRLDDHVPERSRIRLRREDGSTVTVGPASGSGTLVRAWNARTSPAPPMRWSGKRYRPPVLVLPPVSG